jgi:hypothetical protein
MTDTAITADIVAFRKKPLTGAARAAAYRARKRAAASTGAKTAPVTADAPVTPAASPKPVTRAVAVTPVTPSRSIAQLLLVATSFGLAAVGIAMNGWFAHTLGSSQIAGWLFAAIGVAADCVALAMPCCAALKWQASQRGAALAGWLVWSLTFAFAVTAGIGFASVNISDVTSSRAARVTPAVEQAKASLADAMGARDRECAGGTGKNCRAREDMVVERRRLVDQAVSAVGQSADPQTEAASHIVAWLSVGTIRPSSSDVAMLRLILLSLLPQLGGILLMVGRAP